MVRFFFGYLTQKWSYSLGGGYVLRTNVWRPYLDDSWSRAVGAVLKIGEVSKLVQVFLAKCVCLFPIGVCVCVCLLSFLAVYRLLKKTPGLKKEWMKNQINHVLSR